MRPAARAALSEVTAYLRSRGFAAHQPSRRAGQARPGYRATWPTDLQTAHGCAPAVYVFGTYCAPGEFERVCAALVEGGWRLEDCTSARGGRYVELGVARVLPRQAP